MEQEANDLSEALSASLVEETTRLKDAGNVHFKAGENAAAVAMYREALAVGERADTPKAKDELKPVLISLHNNSAAAQIKLEEWAAAEERTKTALDAKKARMVVRTHVAS